MTDRVSFIACAPSSADHISNFCMPVPPKSKHCISITVSAGELKMLTPPVSVIAQCRDQALEDVIRFASFLQMTALPTVHVEPDEVNS